MVSPPWLESQVFFSSPRCLQMLPSIHRAAQESNIIATVTCLEDAKAHAKVFLGSPCPYSSKAAATFSKRLWSYSSCVVGSETLRLAGHSAVC